MELSTRHCVVMTAKITTERWPRSTYKNVERSAARLVDYIVKVACRRWVRLAQDYGG